MKNAIKVIELKASGKRFEGMPDSKSFDTLAANAYQTLGNSYYYNEKYADAIPYLLKVKNNPITKSPTAYENIIYAYQKTGNKAEEQAMIQEGRKAFPDDVTIKHMELNTLMASGRQEELIKSLEESAVKEPGNADILFNLATTYLGMANPKDGKKPANAADLVAKSEDAFLRALKIAPDNPGYNYNLGALYYNQATDINEQMNAITGTSAADNAKYDGLKVKREAMFGKSMPYFEKAYTTLKANAANLSGDDKNTYRSCMIALKEVYARVNQMDKSKAMKAEYDAFK
jgi:predicted Zn-dependent protease